MTPIQLTVNGHAIGETVEPRTHLADLLRERLNLTATHLRCEQGACGACTVLIDGAPARSCITYAVMCEGAEVTTLEGLESDPIMVALREAFTREHGLQCGYCTPGMLMTARDVVLRLPDADAARIRAELSGNLCRCTGYVGIVRAISRVLDLRRSGRWAELAGPQRPLGPVGAWRPLTTPRSSVPAARPPSPVSAASVGDDGDLGLAGRRPNIEIRQAFAVSRPPDEVWSFFADISRVVRCLPGASVTSAPAGDRVDGVMAVKLGPVTARFAGKARIVRDGAARRGSILGAGSDQAGGARARGEADYSVATDGRGGARVDLTIRALLSGPLAQFSRGGIIDELVARITQAFARNIEAELAGGRAGGPEAPLAAGTLLAAVLIGRLKAVVRRLLGR